MKPKTIKLEFPDYGDHEINRLAAVQQLFNDMTLAELARALAWFKGKYKLQWPAT